MKAIYISILGLTLASAVAHGQSRERGDAPMAQPEVIIPIQIEQGAQNLPDVQAPVELPTEVTESSGVMDYINSVRAVQLTQLTALETQTKYFQIMRASFEGSHAMSHAFEKDYDNGTDLQSAAVKGGTVAGATVTVVMDRYLAMKWYRAASPSLGVMKDIWAASRGEVGRLSSVASKTWKSLTVLAKELRLPKNFIPTATFGTFAYIQYENFWVINMSEAQYQAVIQALDVKIKSLEARSAVIANTYVPYSAR